LDKTFVILPRERLGEAIRSHLCGGHPSDRQPTLCHFLSKPMIVNINMLELRMQFGVGAGDQINSLAIVTP
jgi:hypothetical protein